MDNVGFLGIWVGHYSALVDNTGMILQIGIVILWTHLHPFDVVANPLDVLSHAWAVCALTVKCISEVRT